MATISERLALIISADAASAVASVEQLAKSSTSAALADERRTVAAANVAKTEAAATVAVEKRSLAQAKEVGDDDAVAAAEARVAEATKASTLAKADAAVASSAYAASQAKAAAATAGLADAQAVQSVGGLKGALSGLAGSLSSTEKLAVAATAALEFKVVAGGISKLEALGHTVLIVKAAMGGSAEQASLFVGQMKALSIDPTVAEKAMIRLGAAIGDGTSKLGKFGVATADASAANGDLYGTLENLRTAYQASNVVAEKDAILKQLNLRGAQALIPYLQLTAQQIAAINAQTKASGGVLTESDVENAHKLSITTAQLRQEFDNLEIGLAKSFVPALQQGESALLKMIPAAVKLNDVFGAVKTPLGALGAITEPLLAATAGFTSSVSTLWHDAFSGSTKTAAEDMAKAIRDVTEAQGNLDHLRASGTATSSQLAQANQDLSTAEGKVAAEQSLVTGATADGTTAAEAQTVAVTNLTSALQGQQSAQDAVRDSAYSVIDAQAAEGDAQGKLADLIARGPVDLNAVASATDALAAASKGVTSAVQQQTSAQNALNKATEKATALEKAEAASKIALAGDKIGEAKAAEQQAQEKLDALLGSGTATAGQIAAAQAEVKTKTDEVTQSILDQSQAQKDASDLAAKGTDADPAVIVAKQNLATASSNVADAVSKQADAQAKLNAVSMPNEAQYNLDLAAANEKVAQARNGVTDALHGQADKTLALAAANTKLHDSILADAAGVDALRAAIDKAKADGVDVSSLLGILNTASPLGAGAPGAAKGDVARPGPTAPPGAPAPTNDYADRPPPNDPFLSGGRAAGGPVGAYRSYLVGEKGPEVLRMGSAPGVIVPNQGSGTTVTVSQSFHGYDARQVAAEAAREAAWAIRTTVASREPARA